jgi:transposase
VVVIDPSAPYASGIRTALPGAKIAVDKFHLVLLANQMLTAVRQRVTRELLGRRGRKADPAWAHRRMLLTAGERLSRRQLDRLGVVLAADSTDQIGAAWAIKELLRRLLAARDGMDIRRRLHDFYAACADADMPETTRLAATIETWWPAVLVSLELQVTNARTEGFNRTIKQVKRTGCGFRNMTNYRRRIMAHIAVTRPALQTAC